MELLYTSFVVICVCLKSVISSENYDKYEIDSTKMCSDVKEEALVSIGPWKAAIITFGHQNETVKRPSSRNLHKCKVVVTTEEEFGLAAVIEEMRVQGVLDRHTNAWKCEDDYVKLSTAGSTAWSRFLDFWPGDFLKHKATESLCGLRAKRNLFTEVGANANILSTLANNLDVTFHQSKRMTIPNNNYFKIIITTFKHIKEKVFTEACKGRYRCLGTENYCIGEAYRCDGPPNCAFPGGGGDEIQCHEGLSAHPIFSTTTTIITVLAAIVGAGFILGCVVTLVRKFRSRSNSHTQVMTRGVRGETAPPSALQQQQQHTLPPYEAVVMYDVGKTSAPPSPSAPEVPPSYDMLFPEGPPSNLAQNRSPDSVPEHQGDMELPT